VRRRKRSKTPISDRQRKRKRGRRKSKRGRMKWGTSHISKKYLNTREGRETMNNRRMCLPITTEPSWS
jgi:hypothetical protein